MLRRRGYDVTWKTSGTEAREHEEGADHREEGVIEIQKPPRRAAKPKRKTA